MWILGLLIIATGLLISFWGFYTKAIGTLEITLKTILYLVGILYIIIGLSIL